MTKVQQVNNKQGQRKQQQKNQNQDGIESINSNEQQTHKHQNNDKQVTKDSERANKNAELGQGQSTNGMDEQHLINPHCQTQQQQQQKQDNQNIGDHKDQAKKQQQHKQNNTNADDLNNSNKQENTNKNGHYQLNINRPNKGIQGKKPQQQTDIRQNTNNSQQKSQKLQLDGDATKIMTDKHKRGQNISPTTDTKIVESIAGTINTTLATGFQKITQQINSNYKNSRIQQKISTAQQELGTVAHQIKTQIGHIKQQIEENKANKEILTKVQTIQAEFKTTQTYLMTGFNDMVQQIKANTSKTGQIIPLITQLPSNLTKFSQQIQSEFNTFSNSAQTRNNTIKQQMKTMQQNRKNKQKQTHQQFKQLQNKIVAKQRSLNEAVNKYEIAKLENKTKQISQKTELNLKNKQAQLKKLYDGKLSQQKQIQQLNKLRQLIGRLEQQNTSLANENAKVKQQKVSFAKNYELFMQSHKGLQAQNKGLQKECQNSKEAAQKLGVQIAVIKQDMQLSRKLICQFLRSKQSQGLVRQSPTSIAGKALKTVTGGIINFDASAVQKQINNSSLNAIIKKYLIEQQSHIRKCLLQIKLLPMPAISDEGLLRNNKQIASLKQSLAKLKQTNSIAQATHDAIWKLMGEYDKLKQYALQTSKTKALGISIAKNLQSAIASAAKDGKPIKIDKTMGINGKQEIISQYAQEISRQVNSLIQAIVERNKGIKQIKQQFSTFETKSKQQSAKKDAQVSKLKSDNSILQTNLRSAQQNVRAYAQQNTNLQSKLTNLQATSKKALDDYGINLASKQKQYQTNLTNKQNQHKRVVTQLQQSILSKQQQISKLVKEKQVLSNQYKNYKNNAQKKQTLFKQKYKQLQDKSKQQAQSAQQIINQFEVKVTNLKNDLNAAKSTIETAKQQYQKLQKDTTFRLNQMETKCKQQIKKNNKQHKQEQQKQAQRFETFENGMSKLIKQTIDIDGYLNLDNFNTKAPHVKKSIINKIQKLTFLTESFLYHQLAPEQQNFVYDSIRSVVPRSIIGTKTLFQGYKDVTFDRWLAKIVDKPNILVLLKLKNGLQVGGFSQTPFADKQFKKGKGHIMSITNMKKYPIKQKYQGRVVKYDEYMFGFGNNELLIKSNFSFNVMFTSTYCYFDSGSAKITQFIGQQQQEGSYERVEFHQIFFDK